MLDDAKFKFKIYGLLKYKLRNYAAKTSVRSSIFTSINSKKSEQLRGNTVFYGDMAFENADEFSSDGDVCPIALFDVNSVSETDAAELKIDLERCLNAKDMKLLCARLDGARLEELGAEYGISASAVNQRLKTIYKKLTSLGKSLRQCA